MDERYGGFTLQSDKLKEKVRLTNLDRYGVENPLQSEEIREKIKHTCMDRYGVENPLQSEEIREQIKQTNLNKYGVFNWTQRNIPSNTFEQINSQEWWDFQSSFNETYGILQSHLSDTTILRYARKFRPDWEFKPSVSLPHQRVIDFLNQHQIKHTVNDRQQIKPLELDIYIPSKSLAIEVNGVFWHSELAGGKDRNYHVSKTNECEKVGIQLLQFTDYEVLNKLNLIQSMLSYHLMPQTVQKVHGRKCEVINLETNDAKDFLNENHIQGFEKGSIKKGLIYENQLIACLIASKPRYSKDFDLEIIRFCSKQNTQVHGGFSKMIKSLGNVSLISYADKRYSIGKVYESSGWSLSHHSNPSYHYTFDYINLFNRTSFQKHKLSEKLDSYDPAMTEWQNMANHGFDRIWDCGNLVFTKTL